MEYEVSYKKLLPVTWSVILLVKELQVIGVSMNLCRSTNNSLGLGPKFLKLWSKNVEQSAVCTQTTRLKSFAVFKQQLKSHLFNAILDRGAYTFMGAL